MVYGLSTMYLDHVMVYALSTTDVEYVLWCML